MTRRKDGAETNTTKARMNMNLPLTLPTTWEMSYQILPIFILHGRASSPGFIPVSRSKLSQLSGKSLISYCVNLLAFCYYTLWCAFFLSLPVIFFPLHSSKQQYWPYYLQRLINCWKPAASTNWAKLTFSLHSFFPTQSFPTLAQLINRPGLKFCTQNWDFMQNMHLITLNFAWLMFSSVIHFWSCHHQTDIIPPFLLKGKYVLLNCSFIHFWVRTHLLPVCLTPQTLHPSM